MNAICPELLLLFRLLIATSGKQRCDAFKRGGSGIFDGRAKLAGKILDLFTGFFNCLAGIVYDFAGSVSGIFQPSCRGFRGLFGKFHQGLWFIAAA